MRKNNRILILVFSLLILTFAVSAVSAQNCVCLDANGVRYAASAPSNSVCYMCSEDGCTPTALTLAACMPAVEQPVIEQPVIEQPVIEQPVVEQPIIEEPVIEQPVIEQPVIEQPIVEEPVIEQPVIEQPVIEQPIIEEPVIEQPVVEQPEIELVVSDEPVEQDPSDEDEPSQQLVEPQIVIEENEEQPGEISEGVTVEGTEEEQPGEISEGETVEGIAEEQPGEISEEEPVEGTEEEQPGEISEEEPVEGPEEEQPGEISEGVTVEGTEEEQPGEISEGETVEGTEEEQPGEISEGETIEGTEEEQPGEISEEESILSREALDELSRLLGDEELADIVSLLTLDWVKENSEVLSEQTLLELFTLLKQEENTAGLLGSPSPTVLLEGELKDILLFSPSGGTVTTKNVPFIWLYAYDGESGPAEVAFLLQMTITTASDTVTLDTTVSTASCGGNICTYTADLSAYNNSLVSWTVSGTYKSGGTSVVVPGPAPLSFALKFDGPIPPVPPGPKKKPEAPVQECPYGDYEVLKIGFYWAPSKYAESYTVEWHNDRGRHGTANLSNSDPTCQNGRCNVHLTMPGYGAYAWTVTAKNSHGAASSPEMGFYIRSAVSEPTPYRPNGTISNSSRIAFEWSDEGASDYRIQVIGDNDNYIRMDRWFKASDIYVGNGACYVQTDLYLPAGSYSWRVQAANGESTSGWSSWKDFRVSGYSGGGTYTYYYTNTVPTCLYPTGTITLTAPNFQWRTVTGAGYYMVKLYDASGTVLFDRQVASSGNCNAESCTWTPDIKLTKNGNYTWSVSAYGGNGALWNNASGSFALQGAVAQTPMSFISPAQNGLLTQDAPVIIWTDPGTNTAIFHVEIFNSANKLLFSADLNRAQAWCDGKTCSIEFKTIPDAANYRMTITPYSDLNTKGDMITLVFSKGTKVLKLNSPKEGSTVQSRPLFRWALDTASLTASYELTLVDAKNNVTTISPLACGMEGVTCEDGEVFFSPAITLQPGSYTAKLVLTGSNAVSEELHFTVK